MKDRLERLRIALELRRVLAQAPARLHDPERQERRRVALEEFARARSPLFRDGGPSVLTKDHVERLEELVTDRRVTRAAVGAALARPGQVVASRYRVATTSGSSGRPTALVFTRGEWVRHLARAARGRMLAGAVGGVARSAKVASTSPLHMSFQVGETLKDPRRPALRLDAAQPVEEMVRQLNEWRPQILTAYPSVMRQLAHQQLAGHLRIAPERVFTSGELLSVAVRDAVREAWGEEIFDQYVASEAGTIASECTAHTGLHVDDDVAVEIAGDGSALLTVLSSRLMPMIRYAIGDRFEVDASVCACGLASPRIVRFAGREREMIDIGGAVVHPHAFHLVLDAAPVAGWRVVFDDDSVEVLVTPGERPVDCDQLRDALRAALPQVRSLQVRVVDQLERSPGGKATLVTRRR